MKMRFLPAVVFALALTAAACAQGPGAGDRGFGMGAGRGLVGTVTEAAADHYTVKTDAGEFYTVHFSANTRIIRQTPPRRAPGEGGEAPQLLKPSEIKAGDVIAVIGEIDATAKSVGAVAVVQLDPERAKQMREMQANYGKTWLMGKVTAIDAAKITLQGSVDHAAHSVLANENTTFRKRREPITLADVQVGDEVRIEGAVKEGVFWATTISVMGPPPGGMPPMPHDAPPAQEPK
jgi:hypothetical protein